MATTSGFGVHMTSGAVADRARRELVLRATAGGTKRAMPRSRADMQETCGHGTECRFTSHGFESQQALTLALACPVFALLPRVSLSPGGVCVCVCVSMAISLEQEDDLRRPDLPPCDWRPCGFSPTCSPG